VFRKFLVPILSAAGFAFALWMVMRLNQPLPVAPPVAEPPRSPYESRISGSGIVESRTQNIAIGTPVSGVVQGVLVKVAQRVGPGDPLFTLDDRKERAALTVKERAMAETKARLARLQAAPREEELPSARERVREAEANLQDLRHQLLAAEGVSDRRAISQEDLNRRRFAMQAADARLASARASLNLLQAGSWKADIEVARAELSRAEAEVEAARVEIDRLVVRAPVSGDILQMNIRPGEYAQSGALAPPLLLLGDTDRLHVRVDIDENDAWRFRPEGAAVASVRGNPQLKTDLTFEYVEPYVIPKRSLTGDSTERVDTRVMQVVYSFSRAALSVYPGQLMDVFIDDRSASPPKESSPVPSGRP
jgi:HlyD family secretion protein